MKVLRAAQFIGQDRGAVAVEFALVVPVMLMLLFCGFEASRMASAYMRLNDSAQMLADLVSRQQSVTSKQIDDFCNGVERVMTPFLTVGYSATVASVTRFTSGVVVDWQDTSCGSGQTMASAATLVSSYIPNINDSVIVVQATYGYHPVVNTVITPSMPMIRIGLARPRGGTPVKHS
ncbi:MAG: TadE/TadG family type IV pilus assembly protein [Janthinobacterium lividum]